MSTTSADGAGRRLGAALVARMSSSRLPGKVLTEVAGRPLLQYTLERLQRCGVPLDIVLATSTDPGDDALEAFAGEAGIPCVRGSLEDVAGRFLKAVEATGREAVFRVNGDSPLIEMELFRRAAAEYERSGPDLVTNIMPRLYPPGVSVELIKASTYRDAYAEITEPDDREHVTRFLYRQRDRFRIVNLEPEAPYGDLHLAVDTADDLAAFGAAVGRMERPHWEYGLDEIVALYRAS